MTDALLHPQGGFLRQAGRGIRNLLDRSWYTALLGPLLAVLALPLAYQRPAPIALNVGDSYDRPYLSGFHDPERAGAVDYAFTSGSASLRLEGIGRGAALVEVRMGGGVPGVEQVLSAGGIPLLRVAAGGELATYALLVPPEASRSGSLRLTWEGGTASPPEDPRLLGLAVDRVAWTPLRGGVGPDWGQVVWVALAALALYAIARELDFGATCSVAFSLLLVAAVAVAIAVVRLSVTIFTPQLAALLLAIAVLLPFLRRGAFALFRRLGLAPPAAVERWLWRVTVLAALLKLGGVLYPQLIVLDVGAHAYRVSRFLSGDWGSLFLPGGYSHLGRTVGLEGGQFPYSPLFYIVSLPLTLLPIPLPLSMGLLNGLLGVATNLLLYLLAARITGRPRAGLWAAVAYTFLPAPYYLLSWGNYPTQLGLFGALVTVVYLVLAYDRLWRWRAFAWWVAALMLAILSYTVVGVFAVVLLLVVAGFELLPAAGRAQRRRALAIVAGLVLAEGVVFLLYHSAFASVFLRETLPAILRSTADKSIGIGPVQVDPRQSLASNWVANWVYVQNHVTNLGVVFAAAGVVLASVAPAGPRWRPLLLAWPLVFLLFSLFSGLVADTVLKHILFTFPWFCLGVAVLAVTLWRRGLAGRLTVLAYTAFMAWLALSHWLDLILVKRH